MQENRNSCPLTHSSEKLPQQSIVCCGSKHGGSMARIGYAEAAKLLGISRNSVQVKVCRKECRKILIAALERAGK